MLDGTKSITDTFTSLNFSKAQDCRIGVQILRGHQWQTPDLRLLSQFMAKMLEARADDEEVIGSFHEPLNQDTAR